MFFISRWFSKDLNAVPAVYVVHTISTKLPDFVSTNKVSTCFNVFVVSYNNNNNSCQFVERALTNLHTHNNYTKVSHTSYVINC